MQDVGVGVVGCGFVGRGAHVPSFASIEGARLVAVADADAKRRAKATKKYEVEGSYDDYSKLVQDPNVQLVVIALPTPLHAAAALAAINAGKHVICEMPLASNLAEADQIIEAAQKAGVLLIPGLTFRFTPNYVKLKEMMDQGVTGNPTAVLYREFISASDLASQWPADSWMWKFEESGGPLYTLSVWSIDLIRWLLGSEIASVQATTTYTRLEKFGGTFGYDSSVTLRTASGVMGCLQYSGTVNRAASTSAFEVIGDTHCLIRASDNDKVTLLDDQPAKTEWNVKQPGPGMWGHLQQNEYFIQCIRDGRQPEITPEDGRRAMEIALQIGQATAD